MLSQQQVDKDLGVSAPKATVKVQFDNDRVEFGNVIKADKLQQPPSNITWPCKPDTLYTLAFVDLDYPSKKLPEDREMRQWLVVNIPGDDVEKGMELTQYEGPNPPAGTGLHRYVFLIFEQHDVVHIEKVGNRVCWRAHDFAAKHNMKIHAGNYFHAKQD